MGDMCVYALARRLWDQRVADWTLFCQVILRAASLLGSASAELSPVLSLAFAWLARNTHLSPTQSRSIAECTSGYKNASRLHRNLQNDARVLRNLTQVKATNSNGQYSGHTGQGITVLSWLTPLTILILTPPNQSRPQRPLSVQWGRGGVATDDSW